MSNPGVLNVIQQLASLNNIGNTPIPAGGINLNSTQTGATPSPMTTTPIPNSIPNFATNSNQNNSQIVPPGYQKPQQNITPLPMSYPNNQINPIYSMMKGANPVDQHGFYNPIGMQGNKGFYGPPGNQAGFAYPMSPNEMYMQQNMYGNIPMGGNEVHNQQNDPNMNNMEQFKNYYDYLQQNLNNK